MVILDLEYLKHKTIPNKYPILANNRGTMSISLNIIGLFIPLQGSLNLQFLGVRGSLIYLCELITLKNVYVSDRPDEDKQYNFMVPLKQR